MAGRLFTSESVTEGHPDKIADQISDSVLDELLRQDPNSRVAVEMPGHDRAGRRGRRGHHRVLRGDPRVVRERIIDIGYDSSTKGFDGGSCGVEIAIGQQSPDIAQGVDVAFESRTGESTDLARSAGRRRPGPDVRLRLQRDAIADAAADRCWPTDSPSSWPRCARTAPCRTCAPTARPR